MAALYALGTRDRLISPLALREVAWSCFIFTDRRTGSAPIAEK
jgi:hypothetical protein